MISSCHKISDPVKSEANWGPRSREILAASEAVITVSPITRGGCARPKSSCNHPRTIIGIPICTREILSVQAHSWRSGSQSLSEYYLAIHVHGDRMPCRIVLLAHSRSPALIHSAGTAGQRPGSACRGIIGTVAGMLNDFSERIAAARHIVVAVRMTNTMHSLAHAEQV